MTASIDDRPIVAVTSGNQHDMARALARAHLEDPSYPQAGTVSALSPITGSADYR